MRVLESLDIWGYDGERDDDDVGRAVCGGVSSSGNGAPGGASLKFWKLMGGGGEWWRRRATGATVCSVLALFAFRAGLPEAPAAWHTRGRSRARQE